MGGFRDDVDSAIATADETPTATTGDDADLLSALPAFALDEDRPGEANEESGTLECRLGECVE